MAYYVYIHTNKTNGKMYVGITTCPLHKRWGKDGGRYQGNEHFWSAIQKYGWDGFTHEYWEVESEDAMFQCEKDLIAFFNTTDRANGYNHSTGGEGCVGYKWTAEQVAKVSGENNPNYGKPKSDEWKAHMSECMSGDNNPCKGKTPWNKGMTTSTETRKRISDSLMGNTPWNKGKQASNTAKANQSAAKQGKQLAFGHDGKKHYYTPEEIESMGLRKAGYK